MPPNQVPYVTPTTPGMRSICDFCAKGNGNVIEILLREMSRLGAADSTPAYQAAMTVRNRPKARIATPTPPTVSTARSGWRNTFLKSNRKKDIVLLQLSLVEVAHDVRALGGPWIMSDHHDRFLVLGIQPREQIQNV